MAGKRGKLVKNLSYGEQRQIEVTLALISNPVVLLLDEPTAGISPADSAMMAEMIHNLDPEITVLLIEHNMDVALQVASRITVLHLGGVFAEGSPGRSGAIRRFRRSTLEPRNEGERAEEGG